MDDHRFDHIIKDKLESLDPVYNEAAWKELDYRLDLLAPLPWYSRLKSLLIAGSLGMITLLNIGLLYKVDSEQDQLEKLVHLLSKQEPNRVADTVYVISQNYLAASFLDGAAPTKLLASSDATAVYDLLDPLSVYKIRASSSFTPVSSSVAATSAFSAEVTSDEAKLAFNRQIYSISSLDPFSGQYQLNGPEAEDMYVRGVVLPPRKKKWDYPIQPRIGLAAGYLIPDPDLGERFVSSRQSLLIETPIRGNFHLMSGLSFQEFTYKLDDVDDNNFERSTLLEYPQFGSFPSSPDEITVENTMLQIPIYFRYYKPLNRNWSVFAGGGPTIDILLNQKFTYSFLEIRNEQLVKFDKSIKSDDLKVNLGAISGNVGIEHYFNPRFSAQVELNYQYGLGKTGLEERTFNSFAVSGGLFYKLSKRP